MSGTGSRPESAPNRNPPKKNPRRKRRWLRYSLRSLLVLVTLAAILSNYFVRARKRDQAVKAILAAGGTVRYDAAVRPWGGLKTLGRPKRPNPLAWSEPRFSNRIPYWKSSIRNLLRPRLGPNYVDRVIKVHLDLRSGIDTNTDYVLMQVSSGSIKHPNEFDDFDALPVAPLTDEDWRQIRELESVEELSISGSLTGEVLPRSHSTPITLTSQNGVLGRRITINGQVGCIPYSSALPLGREHRQTLIKMAIDEEVAIMSIPLAGLMVGAIAIVLFHVRKSRNDANRHQERMAMIEAGMHPDYLPGDDADEDYSDDSIGARA